MKDAGMNPDGSGRGAMAAGMGPRESVLFLVEKTRGENVLEAVNFNSPQQTVVAGDIAAVERFSELAKEDRSLGVKAIPLSVSGAFHSPIMQPAADGLAEALKEFTFGPPKYEIYLNTTGQPFENTASNSAVKEVMVRQMVNPVLWQKTIESMNDANIDLIIEVGPGKTLSGLTKKIAPELTALHIEDFETLKETIALIKEVM
jgi:[acyl-carrier-protein] S-malonyltransferase